MDNIYLSFFFYLFIYFLLKNKYTEAVAGALKTGKHLKNRKLGESLQTEE